MEQITYEIIVRLREKLDNYILNYPGFEKSLEPYPIKKGMPDEAKLLCHASQKAGIGPMGAVAGLFAQQVGEELAKIFSPKELVVENGGDLYVLVEENLFLTIFAGESLLSEKVGLVVPYEQTPLGVCTSAGTVGPSLSFGKADAVMVACKNTLEADAFATAFGNKIKNPDDIQTVLKSSEEYSEIGSIVAICGEKIGIRGNFEVRFVK